jgi:hypothetical protein
MEADFSGDQMEAGFFSHVIFCGVHYLTPFAEDLHLVSLAMTQIHVSCVDSIHVGCLWLRKV